MDPTRTTAVLLAAGAGTRLGAGPKALLPHRGRPLVETIASTLLEGGCHDVVIVLGAGASTVMASAKINPYRVVVNHKWPSGMGSSYLAGANSTALTDHLLVALVDQPHLTVGTVSRLLNSHRPGRITAAGYTPVGLRRGLHRGHPIVIDSSLREAVASTVVGDAGARKFLLDNPQLVDIVDCSDESTGEDIDTVEQMKRLLYE
ncbi:nicotine blue oxidoreductase [Citricoccus nitrophenolicus]|uniref:nicotine blue oxidoreductase n=1 Tax=Citricoccus nitrophenolicus TaxID=863575 RepID=UPI0039B67A1D